MMNNSLSKYYQKQRKVKKGLVDGTKIYLKGKKKKSVNKVSNDIKISIT